MSGFIAVREVSYGGWDNAITYMGDAGIHHLEVSLRPLEQLQEVAAACDDNGITMSSLAGAVDLDNDDSIAAAGQIAASCGKLDVPIWFCSAKGAELPREEHMARLAALGDRAAEADTTIALETHPPFCHNADEMLRTMDDVDHDNIGINFDTANVFYYNEDIDSADELERVVDDVASLHLKDSDGGFKSANFPVFGEGVVRFGRIKGILEDAQFSGPMTIELEGPVVAGLDPEGRHDIVLQCMEYLKAIKMV